MTRSHRSPAPALLVLCMTAGPLAAQDAWPGWATAWSPLAPIASHVRPLPFGVAADEHLLGLPLRAGPLWTAGNPAGLAWDVGSSQAWLELARAGAGGPYRRPLDSDGIGSWRLGGLGWRPAASGAVIGRIGFESRRARVASATDFLAPHASDPFVVVDTTNPGRSSIHALLEGGVGWRFGGWYAGMALGIETHRNRSLETRFSRVGRSSTSGAALGLGREIAPLGLLVAVHGRWLGRRETHLLTTTPGGSRVFVFAGFHEPEPFDVSPPGAFLRRVNADGFAGGGTVTGRAGALQWTAFVERGGWNAGHVNTVGIADPLTDTWEANGTRLGFVVRAPLMGHTWLLAGADRNALDGEARRADLEGVVFRAEETDLALHGTLTYADPAAPWQAALTVRGRRTRTAHEDFVAQVPSDITAWLGEAALSVTRHFGGTSAGLVLSAGLYTPSARIPDPATLGPAYAAYVAPEQSLYAVGAVPLAGALWVRQRFGGNATAYIRAGGERTGAREPIPQIPALPNGQRHGMRVAIGLELNPEH